MEVPARKGERLWKNGRSWRDALAQVTDVAPVVSARGVYEFMLKVGDPGTRLHGAARALRWALGSAPFWARGTGPHFVAGARRFVAERTGAFGSLVTQVTARLPADVQCTVSGSKAFKALRLTHSGARHATILEPDEDGDGMWAWFELPPNQQFGRHNSTSASAYLEDLGVPAQTRRDRLAVHVRPQSPTQRITGTAAFIEWLLMVAPWY